MDDVVSGTVGRMGRCPLDKWEERMGCMGTSRVLPSVPRAVYQWGPELGLQAGQLTGTVTLFKSSTPLLPFHLPRMGIIEGPPSPAAVVTNKKRSSACSSWAASVSRSCFIFRLGPGRSSAVCRGCKGDEAPVKPRDAASHLHFAEGKQRLGEKGSVQGPAAGEWREFRM